MSSSSTPTEEIELLERVLLRFGCADTDEKLEAAIKKFLAPVLIKIETPHQAVKNKVMDVLTHLNIRLKSRPLVQLPVEDLLNQYQSSNHGLQNFAIIYIIMGYPRMSVEQQTELAPKLLTCFEGKLESHQDKLLLLVLPLLGTMKLPDDPVKRSSVLGLENKPNTKNQLIMLLQDVLLLPYGVTQDATLPPGLSPASFNRIIAKNWKAEELEQLKKGIVRFVCSSVFNDLETFILLVLASSDTRFSVATPALAELNKVCTTLDFTNPDVTAPLYTLFSGNGKTDIERKTKPCSARVRQKLLQYLIRSRGKGINTVRGIQVIFEGLFGENTNNKCKVLSLQFCENLIKDGQKAIVSRVSQVILSGISKLIGRETTEPIDVQNAAYSAMAQLSRTCPEVVNKDLKIVVSYFNCLATASSALHTSIREALVSMAPAFAWNYNAMEIDSSASELNEKELEKRFIPTSQQNLLLAMLTDNAESKLQIVQNVTSVFLTTCFPEHFAPARYLLLLIAGEKSSLRESITTYLYGVSKKDHINYSMLSSVEIPDEITDDFNKLSPEQRRVVLPNFKHMVNHVHDMNKKRLTNSTHRNVVGKVTLGYSFHVFQEILDYLRVCLWYSAGIKAAPGDDKNSGKLKEYILANYEDDEYNEINKYLQLVMTSVEARRDETNLSCLYDLLNATPEILTKNQTNLLEPLAISLKDVSEATRINVAQVYGILLATIFTDDDFNHQIREALSSLCNLSLENRHGWILVFGHAFSRKLIAMGNKKTDLDFSKWSEFIDTIRYLVTMLCEVQPLLVSAAVKGISLIGKTTEIPDFEVEIKQHLEEDEDSVIEKNVKAPTKLIIFGTIFALLKSLSVRQKIREDAAICLGSLAIGDGKYFTVKSLEKLLSFIKLNKDAALNIAISHAIVCTLNGYDVNIGPPSADFTNSNCDDATFDWFLNSVIKLVGDPNPHSRQSCSVWLLGIVKHCSKRPSLLAKKEMLQFAFSELLSDDSEFIQDVASRGLGLVFSLSDENTQKDLANALLEQLIGGKRQVNQVTGETELFPEGFLGKTPTGGNMTTYKELCSLASDLNQPDMVYQFMQLANHNATWNSKLGAAFGLKSISKDAKSKMKPYLGKIVPRLYRYKYDPTPKIQNSMISIWDSIVSDSKEMVELYYWDIMKEILVNLTVNEWRVRIACCLAVRDLLKRPNGLRLRSEEKGNKGSTSESMEIDGDVLEPELKELWVQLFRVMDDIHEGTRLAAEGTVKVLSKICIVAASSNHGKSGMAVAGSILPLILEVGVPHTVPEIRKISIKTISELIDSSGDLITPHLPSLIPCLLRATGELETPSLSYLSSRLAAQGDAQEAVDSFRAEAAKTHHTMETTAKCVRYIDAEALEKVTPPVMELIKTAVNLGTKIACAHFICLVSIRLGDDMTPFVGKYLGVSFTGLKDRNGVVRKYFASAIGHLIGIAKEQSVKNLFTKLEELYTENSDNKGIALAIQAINKRHHELLKDYMENILPLIFLAMHEEITEDNRSNIELWKELWIEVSPGDAGIRLNLHAIVPKLEKSLEDASWSRKAQSANAINTIATKLGSNLDEPNRMRLLNLLLVGIQGRTFQGKERLLEALASLCKGLKRDDEICERIIDAAMKECRKEEPVYRTSALKCLGNILEELEADRFEEVYEMIWYLLDKKDFNEDKDEASHFTVDDKNKHVSKINKLKETVCDTLGKSWPKNHIETQKKHQLQLAQRCANCLKDNTRQVQVSLLIALGKFLDRLKIFDEEIGTNPEKKLKVDPNRDAVIEKICGEVLNALIYVSAMPHTGLKKESLSIFLILIKKLNGEHNAKHLDVVKRSFESNLNIFQKDSAPEVRCRIKDIEDNLKKFDVNYLK